MEEGGGRGAVADIRLEGKEEEGFVRSMEEPAASKKEEERKKIVDILHQRAIRLLGSRRRKEGFLPLTGLGKDKP